MLVNLGFVATGLTVGSSTGAVGQQRLRCARSPVGHVREEKKCGDASGLVPDIAMPEPVAEPASKVFRKVIGHFHLIDFRVFSEEGAEVLGNHVGTGAGDMLWTSRRRRRRAVGWGGRSGCESVRRNQHGGIEKRKLVEVEATRDPEIVES